MPRKVLHITEAFGGGIVSSLYSFAINSSSFEHHLLICERADQPLSKDLSAAFSSITIMSRNVALAIPAIKRAVAKLSPDYVHLHSSYAGVYGRLSGLDPSTTIYSPHGFAFERRSSPKLLRYLYYFIEKILSRRSMIFAGVSIDEVKYAASINPHVRAIFLPNTTDISPSLVTAHADSCLSNIDIVCAGRLCPQKDPDFLVRTLANVPQTLRDRFSVTWIGSGDDNMRRRLLESGVNVTGWVTHEEAARKLANCDLYFHVAAWEGFPMTVIEAAALGRPIVLRRIRAFSGFDLPEGAFVDTPEDAADILSAWVTSAEQRKATNTLSRKVAQITSVERQRSALADLYRIYSA